MVVGALITYFAPSNRGFVRVKENTDVSFESLHNFDEDSDENIDDDSSSNANNNNHHSHHSTRRGSMRESAPVTALRRKPLRAMAVLTSIASDFDIISDWCFFRQSLREDRNYRTAYAANPVEGELPYLVPKRLLISVFITCFLGTIMYLIIATEGRIVAPLSRRMGVDKISMGFVLFIAILVEDVPQIILTFLVEDYYEEGFNLSQMAVLNLTASLYDTCIKLAESFDQRHDVVETGIWCKRSIKGHSQTITDILVLPEGTHIPPPPSPPTPLPAEKPPLVTKQHRSQSVVSFAAPKSRRSSTSSMTSMIDLSSMSLSSFPTSFRRLSQKSMLVEAFFPEEETMSPRTYFLSASLDKTVKLWRVASTEDGLSNQSSSSSKKETCVRVYRDGESGGFTCLAWVGDESTMASEVSTTSTRDLQPKERQSFFLTGCNKGRAKLWDLSGVCHATYEMEDNSTMNRGRIASISTAIIDGRHAFICGHESGAIRLWNTWGVFCMGEVKGHDRRVTSITILLEGLRFVSASTDSTLKLWDTKMLLQRQKTETGIEVEAKTNGGHTIKSSSLDTHQQDKNAVKAKKGVAAAATAVREFIGHRAAVLSVVSVDQKSAILSGSQDGTARLWSIDSGSCLRIFRGHLNGVHSVLAIDRVTFLTGSSDKTVKAWDALSGECLRTYGGHSNTVTGLSTISVSKDETDGATTFISSSADKSIKCWVLTAVSYRDPAATLDNILEFQDSACRCFDAGRYGQPNSISPMNTCGPGQCDFDHPYYQEAPL